MAVEKYQVYFWGFSETLSLNIYAGFLNPHCNIVNYKNFKF